MNCIIQGYKIIYDQEPVNLEEWQIVEKILDNFNVSKLSEGLAKEIILQIVNHTHFPNSETTQRIVGRAESFASELFPELSNKNEIHMADLERIENQNNNWRV